MGSQIAKQINSSTDFYIDEDNPKSIDPIGFINYCLDSANSLIDLKVGTPDPCLLCTKLTTEEEFRLTERIVLLEEILDASLCVLKIDTHFDTYNNGNLSAAYLECMHALSVVNDINIHKYSQSTPKLLRIHANAARMYNYINLAHDAGINDVFPTSVSLLYFKLALISALKLVKYFIIVSMNEYLTDHVIAANTKRNILELAYSPAFTQLPDFDTVWNISQELMFTNKNEYNVDLFTISYIYLKCGHMSHRLLCELANNARRM